jgi:hypothetical protein
MSKQLPPLQVIDAMDKWMHQQTRFHLSDTDGYQEMLAEVATAIDQYAYEYAERVIGDDEPIKDTYNDHSVEIAGCRNRLRASQRKRNAAPIKERTHES